MGAVVRMPRSVFSLQDLEPVCQTCIFCAYCQMQEGLIHLPCAVISDITSEVQEDEPTQRSSSRKSQDDEPLPRPISKKRQEDEPLQRSTSKVYLGFSGSLA